MSFHPAIGRLVDAVRAYLSAFEHPPVKALCDRIRRPVDRGVEPRSLPVLAWLTPALEARSSGSAFGNPLLDALARAADHLAWQQSYGSEAVSQRFVERYGWTEIAGRRGPVLSREMNCGFLLLGPNIEYPSHAHEPEEIYWPLTGGSCWQWDCPGWTRVAAHRPIHHAAWMPHAMRTDNTPLVALYIWYNGDLAQKPSFSG